MADVRLPLLLQAALAELAPDGSSAGRARALSDAYRAERPSSIAVASLGDAAAYAVSRMPATYAAVTAALAETLARIDDFAPSTMLDAGAGPGTASWSALEALPSLASVVQLDHNANLLALGQTLASTAPVLGSAERVRGDLTRALPPGRRFDLVVAAYALTELSDAQLPAAASALWAACGGLLLIVEPGRTRDYERLMQVRMALFDAGARIVAPCPHEAACPLPAGDWCHFSVRLPRSRAHREAKAGTLGYEDEKFSYLAVARPSLASHPADARIIRPPVVKKFEVELPLCTAAGLETRHIPKRQGSAFKAAKKLAWGDALVGGPGGD